MFDKPSSLLTGGVQSRFRRKSSLQRRHLTSRTSEGDFEGTQIVLVRRPGKSKPGDRRTRRTPFVDVDSWYERAADRLRRKGVDWHVLNVAPSNQKSREAFRSVALACEMKFREQKSMDAYHQGLATFRRPTKELTDTALESFKALAPFCGPLKPLFQEIQQELHSSIYPRSESSRGEDTTEIPCFEVVARQEDSIDMLTEENDILQKKLSDQASALMDLEQKASSYLSRTKKLKERLGEKEEELKREKLQLSRSNKAYDRLKSEHEEVLTRAEKSEKSLKEMKEQFKDAKREMQDNLESMQNEMKLLQQQNLDLQGMLTHIKCSTHTAKHA